MSLEVERMRSTWKLPLVILLLLTLTLTASLLLPACSDDGEADGEDGSATTAAENGSGSEDEGSSDGSSSEEVPDPGMYEQEDGTVQAVGILTFRDLEGGLWVVVDTKDPAEAADADVVAVLGASNEIPGPINSYDGKYVSVIGTPRDASVYQAGPFVEMQTIEIITGAISEE
jgi:hypothetical protein